MPTHFDPDDLADAAQHPGEPERDPDLPELDPAVEHALDARWTYLDAERDDPQRASRARLTFSSALLALNGTQLAEYHSLIVTEHLLDAYLGHRDAGQPGTAPE